jgi:4-amino-4-deoxy-L-arabinose transferase-like glycosyltransferase
MKRGLVCCWRSVPTAARVCALVACLNAIGWSFLSPPFQVTDEESHFAYVEQLARTGHLPTSSTADLPLDELQALEDLEVDRVLLHPNHRTIASSAQQTKLESEIAQVAVDPPLPTGGAGSASSEPPLYYALETIPYELGAGAGVLEQLALMRLLSALLAGVTALFAFLFVREALPAVPRTWTVAGLSVAFMPALGYISGAVNSDALLYAVSAAVFFCLARGFRRGLTRPLAIAIGALTAAGMLTKLNFLGLVPGVCLGLALLARSSARGVGALVAGRMLALALAIAVTPACLYILVNLLSHHQALGLGSSAIDTSAQRSFTGELSYIWQLYLPRLPGMHVDFADISPPRELWFDGLVGQYGFEDTFFPRWVDSLALAPTVAVLALAARDALAHSPALRQRGGELVVYLAMAIGLMALIGASSYLWFPAEAAGFPEARYLLPLLPLFGAVLALAARGAGRRSSVAAGALIVTLFMAHDLFSQLQVIARFYG